ncbi:MAG TPA: hypothetical protein VN622_14225 [Clostridia bacterium]|nr:hypothetical protein [Clostridia bacterium]
MTERLRRTTINLPISGALAVAAGVVTWAAQFRGRIEEVELSLGTTGSTSGSTTVDVKKGGASIMAANALQIAQGSATKYVRASPAAASGHPKGLPFEPGDVITVDVTTVPGTASTNGLVTLSIIAQDV